MSITMNNNPTKIKNQQENLLTYVRSLSKPRIKILNYLISLSLKNRVVFPSQETIAHIAGITRKTCSNLLKELSRDGLIEKKYYHRRSCFYVVHSDFFDYSIRSALSHIFSAFKLLQITLLLSININSKFQSEYVTPLYYKDIRYNNYSKKVPVENGMDKLVSADNPISIAIRDLNFLHLTKWGQIKLSAFPEDVIYEAKEEYLKYEMPGIRDHFSYFMVSCLKICKEKNITPNWNWSRQLAHYYKMPLNPRYVLSAKEASTVSSKKTSELVSSIKPIAANLKRDERICNGSNRLYPDYVHKEHQKEDDQTRTSLVQNWIGTQEAQNFLQLVGPSIFEMFVKNRLKGEIKNV
jgi:DNA-binding Lrp family transcriptional regulator